MKSIAFFNNKGGVGKTTLVYHIAHMFALQGDTVLVADLDPQANATTMFIADDELEPLLESHDHQTIYGAITPLIKGTGDIATVPLCEISDRLFLVPGDLALATFEDRLSDAWPRCHNSDEAAFRTMTALYRVVLRAARAASAEWVLIDVGPNLGAINRAALIASDHVVMPVGPDLYSVQGMKNLGPTLRRWRQSWVDLKPKCPSDDIDLPDGVMEPIGYVVLQHGIRDNRPPKAYQRWIDRLPSTFHDAVLGEAGTDIDAEADPYCLATIKHYRSLMPMAMEARKPIFCLTPADGAIGAHVEAVARARSDFARLAARIRRSVDAE